MTTTQLNLAFYLVVLATTLTSTFVILISSPKYLTKANIYLIINPLVKQLAMITLLWILVVLLCINV